MVSNDLLQLQGVKKSFGANQVLRGIDFKVGRGEVVALLGDNGAGKSTLIKTINGFHRPTEGKIYFEGRRVFYDDHKGPEQARHMGIETVYQHLGLINTMSITRNFFLGRELVKKRLGVGYLDMAKMRSIVEERLTEIGLTRKLSPDADVSVLSGGERQTIAISRARYFGAKLLILDEPTSALSVYQTKKVLNNIREATEAGLGVVYITHNLTHLKGLVDRSYVLFQGSVVGCFDGKQPPVEEVTRLMTQGMPN